MGARSPRTFPPPGAYALSSPVGVVSQAQPEQILPPQQFLDPGSYSGAGSAAAPAAPVKVKQGGGRGRFFSDQELDGFGGGGNPRKPIFPPPVKKPHLPPGGTLTAYKIDSGY